MLYHINYMVLKLNYIFRYSFYTKLKKRYAYAFSIHKFTKKNDYK